MPKPTNASLAKGIGTTVPRAASWTAFDALPRSVRHVLWEAPVPINPLDARTLVDMAGQEQAIDALAGAIYQEITRFADQHREAFGYQLPHVAAVASLQPYGGQSGSRSQKRRSQRATQKTTPGAKGRRLGAVSG